MSVDNLPDQLRRIDMEVSGAILNVPGVGSLEAWGTTVPTDGNSGYAPGCKFIDTDSGAEYINEGTYASCDFNKIVTENTLPALTLASIESQFDTTFTTGGANSGRGPSTGIWATCPVIDYMLDPTKGMVYFNDLHGSHALAANQTKTYLGGGISGFTGATAGSTIASVSTDPDGALILSTTTDNESVGVQALGALDTAGQFVLATGKKSWFEARIKAVNITDAKFGLFCGFAEEGLLAEDGVLSDADALPDKDYIGFLRVAADGDKLDTVHRKAAGAAVVVQTDAVTVVADTYIKVGFYCDGTTVTFYANGVALATTCLLATATVPTGEEMAFYFVLNAAHGDDCSANIDWVRVAREF